MKHYVVQVKRHDTNVWADVLYTYDKDRATRFVKRMQGNPRARAGQAVDTEAETQGQEVEQ